MENCNGGISNGDVSGLSSKREKLIIDTDPGIGEASFICFEVLTLINQHPLGLRVLESVYLKSICGKVLIFKLS